MHTHRFDREPSEFLTPTHKQRGVQILNHSAIQTLQKAVCGNADLLY